MDIQTWAVLTVYQLTITKNEYVLKRWLFASKELKFSSKK